MNTNNITFAGHSAVFVDISGKTIAIDPWLEGNPLCPKSIAESPKCDIIVLTHGHSDHAGDAVRVAKKTGAPIVATFELAAILAEEGIPWERLYPLNKGGSLTVLDITIALTHALHSSSFDRASGPVYAGEPCGVILKSKDWCVYHAGDTCLFSDMKLIGELYEPDVALLPIGDRFTMGPREAAYAATLVGARVTIPIHYQTFDMLTGTAEEFVSECSKRSKEALIIRPGDTQKF